MASNSVSEPPHLHRRWGQRHIINQHNQHDLMLKNYDDRNRSQNYVYC